MAPPVLPIPRPNIMQHPSQDRAQNGLIAKFGQNQDWSTVGDLHGNVMYFLYFAVHRGAMQMSVETYAELADIYRRWSEAKTVDLRRIERNRFRELISTIEVAPGAKLRLIGDELCDRGEDDDLNLDPLDIFDEKGGIYETILSNHTACFILCIESAIHKATAPDGTFSEQAFIDAFAQEVPRILAGAKTTQDSSRRMAQVRSFLILQYSIKYRTTSVSELLRRYNKHKKSFKAFSYDIDSNGKIVIYSHAAISKQKIIDVAKEMIENFDNAEREALSKLRWKFFLKDSDMIPIIDAINRVVAHKSKENRLSDLFCDKNNKKTKFYDAVENRDDPCDDDINNTHGHDRKMFGNRTTLDGLTGRPDAPSQGSELDGLTGRPDVSSQGSDLCYTSTRPWELNEYVEEKSPHSWWSVLGWLALSTILVASSVAAVVLTGVDIHMSNAWLYSIGAVVDCILAAVFAFFGTKKQDVPKPVTPSALEEASVASAASLTVGGAKLDQPIPGTTPQGTPVTLSQTKSQTAQEQEENNRPYFNNPWN